MSSLESLIGEIDAQMAKQYTYNELLTITSNFADMIGSGGFSSVYKGQLGNDVQVAVKVLNGSKVIEEVFESEILVMASTYHRHLIKIYGYCYEDNKFALVFEYMENGSLDRILSDKFSSIEWHKVYNIAAEIAKVLAYLHHGCDVQILHRDVKPSNVLLDENYYAKLTDFGLASFMDGDESDETNAEIKGTRGYMAPEAVMMLSVVTFKCDVYSFGMLLFDILKWRRSSMRGSWFPQVVWEEFERNKLDEIIRDCGIREEDRKKATILAMVALWCVQFTPETRPSMSTVLAVLEKQMHVNAPPNPFLLSDPAISMQPEMNYSQVYSSVSESVDTQLDCEIFIEQPSELVADIDGRSGPDMQQIWQSVKEQEAQLMPDNEGKRVIGNAKTLEKILTYVEKKHSITNEVCGSILAKMEQLQIKCNIHEEEKKLEELRIYVEMKQSVTKEVCESIMKIMKEV